MAQTRPPLAAINVGKTEGYPNLFFLLSF